ncbi:MAG: AAA family ATPase [Thermogutta sp.]|nr:AAA family ATPase [Thermogutta sp.]HPU06028.1 AAA family ATPase [Thermogutta sp.]
MRLWYYAKGPNRFGPIEEAELRRRLGTGEIAAEDWLWTEGMSNWVKAAEWLRTAGDPVVEKPIVAEAVAGPSAAVVVTASPPPVNDLAAGSLSQRMLPVRELYERIEREVRKVFVGQDELVLGTLTALFSGGHVLIESVPGLGKTLFVRTLGRVLGCKFNRIQFTADLMPSDITGSPIFDVKTQEFIFRPGPVFTNILLADEINRSPAKTHAALLEVMQELSVTVERTRHKLDRPFMVLATQNPVESEGTYNLPEAQMDRFMFKLIMDYPREEEEARILILHSVREDIDQRLQELSVVTNPEEIMSVTRLAGEVRVDPKLVNYINALVRKTRNWPQILVGASPRAGLALMQAARTLAAFRGRDYAVPDDVVDLALPALRHRVILAPEAEVEGYRVDDVLHEVIRSVEVPRL